MIRIFDGFFKQRKRSFYKRQKGVNANLKQAFSKIKSEFDLLTDFIVSFLLFIFLLVVIARQYSEFLLNLICFFITVYATFKMFNTWKKYTRSKENVSL